MDSPASRIGPVSKTGRASEDAYADMRDALKAERDTALAPWKAHDGGRLGYAGPGDLYEPADGA